MTRKHAESVGSAAPDPVAGQAAVQPIPQVAVSNKPAPGQTGPRGMGPRQTYSRVNTGLPPIPEAGLTVQKNGPNLGLNTLPKLSEAPMNQMLLPHADLNSLLKDAMAGTASRAQVAAEAARQLMQHNGESPTKVASAADAPRHYATEQVEKLAAAMAYVADELEKVAEPGEGPGALTVTETTTTGTSLQPGQSGEATSGNQPPRKTSTQPDQTPGAAASTGLETNDDMTHPAQPVEPIKNEKASLENDKSKTATDLFAKNASRINALADKAKNFGKQLGTAAKAQPAAAATLGGMVGTAALLKATSGKKKEASNIFDIIRAKQAEDSSGAQISAGTAPDAGESPTGATPSEEGSVAVPSDVSSQASMLASNDAAINYTKGQAKADPKKDLRQLLREPPLSASTDKVLSQSLVNAGTAGVKIAELREGAVQAMAARALLTNLLNPKV